ncbi:MAG: hypothetical protein AAGB31_12460 [Bdellovibrio sp.]
MRDLELRRGAQINHLDDIWFCYPKIVNLLTGQLTYSANLFHKSSMA